jgi:hypothetical protein
MEVYRDIKNSFLLGLEMDSNLIKNVKENENQLTFNLGYQTKIAGIVGFLLIMSYIIFLPVMVLFLKSFESWRFLSVAISCILILHFILYLIRTKGDNIKVIIEKPKTNDNKVIYYIIYQNKIVKQDFLYNAQIVVKPYKTYKGIYYNIPTIHFSVILRLKETPELLKKRIKEEELALYNKENEMDAVKGAKKIFQFIGIENPEIQVESLSDTII